MKYVDPLPVRCPNCGKTYDYPIKELLNSRAECLGCHYRFDSISKELRDRSAYLSYIMIDLVNFLLSLEDKLGIQFEDREIEKLKTLEDVFRLGLAKLPAETDAKKIEQTIIAAAARAGNYAIEQLTLELDLREVLERQ